VRSKMSPYNYNCIVCGKERMHESQLMISRELCSSCLQKAEKKEKWMYYQVCTILNIQKREGKFIVKGLEYNPDKYGLQRISCNSINNTIKFYCYFGRNTQPSVTISFNKLEELKERLIEIINQVNLSYVAQFVRYSKLIELKEEVEK